MWGLIIVIVVCLMAAAGIVYLMYRMEKRFVRKEKEGWEKLQKEVNSWSEKQLDETIGR